MDTICIKMKETVDSLESGEVYEVDSKAGKSYIEAGKADEVTSEIEKKLAQIEKNMESSMIDLAEKVSKSIRRASEVSAPAVLVNQEKDWSLGDFALKVREKDHKGLINRYGEKVLSTSGDAAIVPDPLAAQLLASAAPANSISARVVARPMTSLTQNFMVLDQAGVTPSNGSVCYYGGVVGAYDSEDDDANATEPAFAKVTLTAKKYTAYCVDTLELQHSSAVDLNSYLTQLLVNARATHRDYFLLKGTAPIVGVIDHAATVEVTRTAAGIAEADIWNMMARMHNDSAGWTWIASRSTLPELAELESITGKGLFDFATNTLVGIPVIFSPFCSALDTAGDLILANFADGYAYGELLQTKISYSDQVYWLKGRRAWKIEAIDAGKPVHASTLTDGDGSTEISPFVQLGSADSSGA